MHEATKSIILYKWTMKAMEMGKCDSSLSLGTYWLDLTYKEEAGGSAWIGSQVSNTKATLGLRFGVISIKLG